MAECPFLQWTGLGFLHNIERYPSAFSREDDLAISNGVDYHLILLPFFMMWK